MSAGFETTASGGRRVPLLRPLTGHAGPIKSLMLRAPGWPDYMAIGEIKIPARQGDTVTVIDDIEAIGKYAERLAGDDAEFLVQLSLPDTLAVHEAVKDFFEQARSGKPPSTLSSGSAGDPETSGT